jgi:Fe2+ or Zn2+ uptake regulation protein
VPVRAARASARRTIAELTRFDLLLIEKSSKHGAAVAPSPATVMLEALRASGLKLTPQRRAIVQLFAGDPTHPTAQEIYQRLSETIPGMSFATVYNTLAKLREAGLCREIAVASGPARFDPNVDRHHHTVCDRCGAVRDVPARGASAPAVPGFHVRSVEHIYRGLCDACAQPAEPPRDRAT